jgi:hypothetical protein
MSQGSEPHLPYQNEATLNAGNVTFLFSTAILQVIYQFYVSAAMKLLVCHNS